MAIIVKCPGCEATRRLKDEAKGKAIVCKECGQRFRVEKTATPHKKLKVKQRRRKTTSKSAEQKEELPESKRRAMPWIPVLASAALMVVVAGIYLIVFSAPASTEEISKKGSEKSENEDPAEKPELFKADKDRIAEITLAVMNCVDSYDYFPATDGLGLTKSKYKHGNLSWRVFILPYLDQMPLYKKFNLNEPWDSANNKPLIREMPSVFGEDRSGKTAYRVLDFKNSVMASMVKYPEQRDEETIRYGQSDTGFLFVVGKEKEVIWTKPGGVEFDPSRQKTIAEVLGKPPIKEGWLMSYFYQQRHALSFSIIPPETPMAKFDAVANRNERDRIRKPSTFSQIKKHFYIDSYGEKQKLRADFDK